MKVGLLFGILYLAWNGSLGADEIDGAPFAKFASLPRWGVNQQEQANYFNAERQRLGPRFQDALLKYVGEDCQKHYWCANFLSSDSYLQGQPAMPELALLLLHQGISICQEGPGDEEGQYQLVSFNVLAANLCQRMGLLRQAQHFKGIVRQLLARNPDLAGGWPAMDETDQRLYVSIAVRNSKGQSQAYGTPDNRAPGDAMIQDYLRVETEKLEAQFLEPGLTAEGWTKARPQFLQEYLYMLGLSPLPPRTDLAAATTSQIKGEGYVVEMLHFQSRPHLYVTANLYRPAAQTPGETFPAVLYLCGHAGRGRNGNKTAFQSHGIWFARHGYVCLVVDTLQLGEIAGIHHGTYRENRWSWHSRGYTPAGVECWNGIRALDYLVSRPEVDADRLAITGISGGGAATFWIAAADSRIKVAVPVSGMADLQSYVPNQVINGHCDCMFLYNAVGWPWTRIAGLIAPRPLLFINSDQDAIFPMDANERVSNRLEHLYSLFGASDRMDTVVSVGGHAYRQDIRQAAFRFLNTYLKNDPRPVLDSELDLVIEDGQQPFHPLDPEKLRVFPTDADLPRDQVNSRIDETFVPVAEVQVPTCEQYPDWRKSLLEELHRVTFRHFPVRIPPAKSIGQSAPRVEKLATEGGIEIRLRLPEPGAVPVPKRIWLVVSTKPGDACEWLKPQLETNDSLYICEPRGIGETRWTVKNPPNYVERAHALLGRTVDTGRVWDVIAAVRYLNEKSAGKVPVWVAGEDGAALLAAGAALWEPEIAGVALHQPPASLQDSLAPQFLNLLRVCDVPEVLGMLAPRPLTITGHNQEEFAKVCQIYRAAGAEPQLTFR